MGSQGAREKGRAPRDLLLGRRRDVCCMLYAYAKNEQGDLTRAQIRVLARLVREEFK